MHQKVKKSTKLCNVNKGQSYSLKTSLNSSLQQNKLPPCQAIWYLSLISTRFLRLSANEQDKETITDGKYCMPDLRLRECWKFFGECCYRSPHPRVFQLMADIVAGHCHHKAVKCTLFPAGVLCDQQSSQSTPAGKRRRKRSKVILETVQRESKRNSSIVPLSAGFLLLITVTTSTYHTAEDGKTNKSLR